MKELKKEAVRFNAAYLTLYSVDSAYSFYTEKMGFQNRPRSNLLQWKVPPLNSSEGKRLLPEGRPTGMGPAGPVSTSLSSAQIQKALRTVANKRTAKVVSKKTRVSTPVLPSVNTKTAASSAMIQKALAIVRKSPSTVKLPPLRTFKKTPSPKKLPPLRTFKKTPSPRRLSPLPSVRKTRSPKSKQGNTRVNRLRKSQRENA